jgi:hypothetical protein
VINVEPLDLSLPSFLYCVLYVVNVEPVDLSLPSFLYCVLYVVNEMMEGIGQPVQH